MRDGIEKKREEKIEKKEQKIKRGRETEGDGVDRKITLVPGRNIPGTNIHICTGWIPGTNGGFHPLQMPVFLVVYGTLSLSTESDMLCEGMQSLNMSKLGP
jgi:hypothetical protein